MTYCQNDIGASYNAGMNRHFKTNCRFPVFPPLATVSIWAQIPDQGTVGGIRSGEIHYARVPKESWDHRLRMARTLGLSVVRFNRSVCGQIDSPSPPRFGCPGVMIALAI